jgi:hypothetical protein
VPALPTTKPLARGAVIIGGVLVAVSPMFTW